MGTVMVILQIVVAAGMVEMHLPASLRSLHQAIGTALWISVVALAAAGAAGVFLAPGRLAPPAMPRPLTGAAGAAAVSSALASSAAGAAAAAGSG